MTAISFKQSIFRRLLLDGFSRGAFFFINLLVARTLPVGEFGQFTFAIFISQLFGVFGDLGFNVQMSKELGERRHTDPTHWRGFFEVKIACLGLSLLGFVVAAPYFWHWPHVYLVVLTYFWFMSNSFFDFFQTVCNGLNRLDVAAPHLYIHRGFILAGILVPALLFPTLSTLIWGLFLGAIIGFSLSTILFLRKMSQGFKFSVRWKEWKRILHVSLPHGASMIFRIWYSRLGGIILAWYVTAEAIGEFSAAFRIYEIGFIVSASMLSVGLPHLAEALTHHGNFRHELMKMVKLFGALTLLGVGLMYFVGPTFITVVFGKNYANAVPILMVFMLGVGFVFFKDLSASLIILFNRQKRFTLHEFLMVFLSLALYVQFIPSKGALGAAWAMVIVEVALTTLNVLFLGFLYWRTRRAQAA